MSFIFGNSYQKLLERRSAPEQAIEQEIPSSPIQSIPLNIGNPFQESAARVVAQGGGKIAETTSQWLGRNAARAGARLGELPSDILQSAVRSGEMKNAMEEYTDTGKIPSPEEQEIKAKEDIRRNRILLNQRKLTPEEEKKMAKRKEFLTGDYLREIEKKYTGDYLQPQSENEKIFDEFVQDAGAYMLMPGEGALSTGMRALETGARAITGSALAQITKQGVKAYGGSPTAQEASKIVPLTLVSMFCPYGATNLYRQFYRNAREAAGHDFTSSRALDAALRVIEQRQGAGTETAATREVLGQTAGIRRHMRGGRIGLENLSETKHTVNAQLQKYMMEEPSTSLRATARNELLNINHALTETINQTEHSNPAYHQAQRAGDEVFGAIAGSQRPIRWIMENRDMLSKIGLSSAAMSALYGKVPLAGTFVGGLLKGTTEAAGVAAAYKGIQIGYRMLRSPILRRYYFESLEEAGRRNLPAFANSVRKLMKKAKEEDPELVEMLENEQYSPETK